MAKVGEGKGVEGERRWGRREKEDAGKVGEGPVPHGVRGEAEKGGSRK